MVRIRHLFALVILATFVTVIYGKALQPTAEDRKIMEKLGRTFCVRSTPAKKRAASQQCNKLESYPGSNELFQRCLKDVMRLTQGNKPAFCFYMHPKTPKLIRCIDQGESDLEAEGIDVSEETQQKFKKIYMDCLLKAYDA